MRFAPEVPSSRGVTNGIKTYQICIYISHMLICIFFTCLSELIHLLIVSYNYLQFVALCLNAAFQFMKFTVFPQIEKTYTKDISYTVHILYIILVFNILDFKHLQTFPAFEQLLPGDQKTSPMSSVKIRITSRPFQMFMYCPVRKKTTRNNWICWKVNWKQNEKDRNPKKWWQMMVDMWKKMLSP